MDVPTHLILTFAKAATALRGQQLECHDSPPDWQDCEKGFNTWKTADAVQVPGAVLLALEMVGRAHGETFRSGPIAWQGMAHNKFAAPWTQHAVLMSQETGSALAGTCGGGVHFLASVQPSPLEGRLQAPQDRYDGSVVAPADELPEEFMESVPVTVPLDEIPSKFSHYLTSIDTQRRRPDVMGLTARFYKVKPTETECGRPGPAPVSSAIDRALDYRMGFTGGFQRFLQQRAKHADAGSYFYGKWTGTINILEKGTYVFDLDLGFDTTSSIKIDGKELLTHGQCRASKAPYACAVKRCIWLDGSCVAPTGVPGWLRQAASLLQQHGFQS
ncbi:unnamed protein product [Durusdinium trenchii]|uniref:PA14 domain-containing protein n=1 Tax=Durusdinium trenchii TaxID=1381693 RepID=A0ABP0IYN0_9DINO